MISEASQPLIREIESPADPAWPGWKSVYLESFPESERMSEAFFDRLFVRKAAGDDRDSRLLVMGPETRPEEVIGIAFFSLDAEAGAGFLWYLATRRDLRGAGYGAALYREVLAHSGEAARLLLFEVEIPEKAEEDGPEAADLARRRIDWYRRQGARLLGGVHYLQSVDTGVPPTEMHVMAHPLVPMDAGEVFAAAQSVFGEAIRQTGPLSLR